MKNVETLIKEAMASTDSTQGLKAWAAGRGATKPGTTDAVHEVLNNLGYTGSIQDQWDAFLDDAGYTGDLTEKLRLFWEGDGLADTPRFLFTGGEEGAWYDPSDLTTLFQDTAGTTPVTADGQPVGLMLDKSKGLVLQPSAAVFSQSFLTAGWATVGVATIPSSNTFLTASTAGQGVITNTSPLVVGKYYRVRIEVSGPSGSVFNIRLTTTGADYLPAFMDGTTQVIEGTLGPITGGNENIYLRGASVSGATFTFGTIEVQELPGHHAIQATPAARPLYKTAGGLHWLEFDGVDDGLHFLYVATIGTPATLGVTASVGWAIKAGTAAARILSHNYGSSYPGFAARGANTSTGSQYSVVQTNFGLTPNALDPFVFTSWSTALVDVESRAYGNVYGAETIGTSADSALTTQAIDRHSLGNRSDGAVPGNGGLLYGACVRFAPGTDEEASQLTSYMLAKAGVLV